MNACYEPPDLGSSIQQAHARRCRRRTAIRELLALSDRSRIVSTVEEAIGTGGQPA